MQNGIYGRIGHSYISMVSITHTLLRSFVSDAQCLPRTGYFFELPLDFAATYISDQLMVRSSTFLSMSSPDSQLISNVLLLLLLL